MRSRLPVGAAVLSAALALAAALSGCGGSTAKVASLPGTTVATTAPSPVSTAATTTAPARTAVAAGFVPQSFTAVSEDDYWVLGTEPCDRGTCTAIARTTDGGGSFDAIAAPALGSAGGAGGEPTLRFADRSDGFAFVTGAGGAFYATHDGGSSWQRLQVGSLVAFATGGGDAYAVTARCSTAGCGGFRFERSPISRDAWTSVPLPFAPDGSVLDLSAHGASVWLLGTPAGDGTTQHDLLARSTDGGRSFTVGAGPCYPGLGGGLAPSSAAVVWAVCPTGMLASVLRSTDGGATFASVHTPTELANSTLLAQASDTTALLVPGGAGSSPLLTTDAGLTWRAPAIPTGGTFWPWAGFTDSTTGAALVQPAAGGGAEELWRTTDGGSSWHDVRFG